MNRAIPPLCLVLAVLLLVAGFAILALDRPEPGIKLHEATAADDEDRRDALEAELERQRWKRKVLIGTVFGMAVVMAGTAFVAIRPARQRDSGPSLG